MVPGSPGSKTSKAAEVSFGYITGGLIIEVPFIYLNRVTVNLI